MNDDVPEQHMGLSGRVRRLCMRVDDNSPPFVWYIFPLVGVLISRGYLPVETIGVLLFFGAMVLVGKRANNSEHIDEVSRRV